MSELTLLNGPVWLAPHVREAMAGPMCDVRHPRFRDAYDVCRAGVRELLDAPDHGVVLAAGSGTFGVELVLRSVLAGERVLAAVAGAYGERMARIAELAGGRVTRVTAPLGAVVSPAALDEALTRMRHDFVLLVHVEPSTGTQLDLSGLAQVCRRHGAIPIVDAVCSAFAVELSCAIDGLGAVITASQKGLSLPPGLAVCAVSPELVARARHVPPERTGLYGRLESWLGPMMFTPPVAHVFALEASLAHIRAETLALRARRHADSARRVHAWARAPGVRRVVADDAAAAHTLTALYYPGGRDDAWLTDLRDRHGLELAPANDARLTGQGFRIGHLGDLPPEHLEAALAVLDRALVQP